MKNAREGWAVPAMVFVVGMILLAIVAEISRPKPELKPRGIVSAIMDEAKNDALMEVTRIVEKPAATGSEASHPLPLLDSTAPQSVPGTEALRLMSNATAMKITVPPSSGVPYTRTPHTDLQCGDPRVAAWAQWPTVWEIWCLDGAVEQRVAGAWPEPPPVTPWPESYDTGRHGASAMKGMSDEHATNLVRSGETTKATIGAAISGGELPYGIGRRVSSQTNSLLSDPITVEVSQSFGWRTAQVGDRYCPRSPRVGWCDVTASAIPGATYLTYAGRLTHVTLLDCGDEHVLEAISQKWANVFCIAADGKVARYNADDAKLTPMLVFSNHDRLMMGRGTEGVAR